MIDSVLAHVDAARAAQPWRELGLEAGGYALVTLHRPSLVDDDDRLAATVDGLIALRRSLPVVFPVHPRTRARLERLGLDRRLEAEGVTVTSPLGYLAFLGLEAEARLVLTDSGGVQEETSALGVPCFTLRDGTERPVTVELGTNTVLGARPERIAEIPGLLGATGSRRADPAVGRPGRGSRRGGAPRLPRESRMIGPRPARPPRPHEKGRARVHSPARGGRPHGRGEARPLPRLS